MVSMITPNRILLPPVVRPPAGRTWGAVTLALGCMLTACGSDPATDGGVGGDISGGRGGEVGHGGGGIGGQGGGELGGGGDTPVADGSWDHPYMMTRLPTIVDGNTVNAPSHEADSYYPCAPNTNEGGAEVVYRLTVPAAGWLSAQLDDVPGDEVDVDVQLLAAASADKCITRHDSWLGAPVTAGEYWLVVDSWVNGEGAAMPGHYTLEVTLTEQGNMGCLTSPIECDGMLPPFVNLAVAEQPGDVGCLPGMLRVDAFCIDRYEAMVVALDQNNNWQPLSPYAHPASGDVLMALSVGGAVPQGNISQIQAEDACMMAGKRLCHDSEWLRACQGAIPTTYPYGNVLEPGRCNDARACHPVPQYFESAASWIWSELDHPCISQLPEGLATTGSYADCTSAEGAFDMMGNLHEWTSDPAGTFRGGFYVDTALNGDGCLYATTAHNVSHYDYSTGFRCCTEVSAAAKYR